PVNLKAKRANYRHMLSIPFISVVRQSLAALLALAMLSTQFFVGEIRANAQQPSDQELSGQNHSGKRLPDEQELAMQREALNGYGKDVSTTFDDQGIPKYLMGTLSDRLNEDDPVAEAKMALQLHGAAFRRSRDDDFSYRTHEKDQLGMTHVRMTQTYKGVPVVGGELIVHL